MCIPSISYTKYERARHGRINQKLLPPVLHMIGHCRTRRAPRRHMIDRTLTQQSRRGNPAWACSGTWATSRELRYASFPRSDWSGGGRSSAPVLYRRRIYYQPTGPRESPPGTWGHRPFPFHCGRPSKRDHGVVKNTPWLRH